MPDVLVLGLGPAGRAIAHRCAAAGLAVTAIDPHPDRQWTSTFGAWADELPTWLSPNVIAARAPHPASRVADVVVMEREYVVFDTAALQRSLSLDSVHVVRGRIGDEDSSTARVVIDARGVQGAPDLPEQTAFGVVVSEADAAPVLEGQSAWFMDWRLDNGAGADEPPSFLYAVPLGGGRVLLEETCLAGIPGLAQRVLRDRLTTRLASRGLHLSGDEPTERVRFALHPPNDIAAHGSLAYGARGGLMHPASGFSVAAALSWADPVAAAIKARRDPAQLLWPRQARAADALRRRGLYVLLALDPVQLLEFFAGYFRIPALRQRDFLSNRSSGAAVAAAMAATFLRLPPRLQLRVARASVAPSRRQC